MTHYPHMLSEDTDVWTKYLQRPVKPILEVWYDVHVGSGMADHFAGDALGTRIASGVLRKRIDAVCLLEDSIWVVEIKPLASMLALGQVISYYRMFVSEYSIIRRVFPVVICDAVDEDLISTYRAAGVGLIVNE